MLDVVLSTTQKCLDVFFIELDFCLLFFSPLVTFPLLRSEYLNKTNCGVSISFWLKVPKCSVHHGGDTMAQEFTS